ncbi:hypothetical protein EAG18_02185 [Pseudoalteromonas sp. J010]|nr:hypothetical protein EAG18_02185 [Pseudoalteromonas sp. J010]
MAWLIAIYQVKRIHFVRWGAYTQGCFAIMPFVPAPVIEKLCVRQSIEFNDSLYSAGTISHSVTSRCVSVALHNADQIVTKCTF